MNGTMLIIGSAALLGYVRGGRSKKKKLTGAVLWGVAGWAFAAYGLPAIQRRLPAA